MAGNPPTPKCPTSFERVRINASPTSLEDYKKRPEDSVKTEQNILSLQRQGGKLAVIKKCCSTELHLHAHTDKALQKEREEWTPLSLEGTAAFSTRAQSKALALRSKIAQQGAARLTVNKDRAWKLHSGNPGTSIIRKLCLFSTCRKENGLRILNPFLALFHTRSITLTHSRSSWIWRIREWAFFSLDPVGSYIFPSPL